MTDERKVPRCPSCGARVPPPQHPRDRPAFAPFCSERCKLVDLGRWLRGEHALPGEPAPVVDDADA